MGLISKKSATMEHGRAVSLGVGLCSEGMYAADNTPKPYSQLAAIQVGAFLKAGAMAFRAEETAANGKDKGCFEVMFDKLPKAILDLEKTVLGIKARGDKAAAVKLRE